MHSPLFDPAALLPLFRSVALASLLGGALLILVLGLRKMLGRRLSSASRCLLWLPVCALLIAPRLPDVGLRWGREALATPQILPAPAQPPSKTRHAAPPPEPSSAPPLIASTGEAAPPMPLETLLALTWAAGVAVLGLGWLAAFAFLGRRVRRSSGPVPEETARLFAESARLMGLRRVPAIGVTSAVASPALMGLLRPVLLLPPRLEERLSPEELCLVLRHEAGHVKRHDLLFHWLSLGLLALHWFNPLCWIAAWLFRMDRESACDAAVLRASRQDCRALYGHTLIKLQASLADVPGLRPLVGVLGSADMLRRRIVEIAAPGRTSHLAGIFAGALAVMASAGIAIMAAEPAKPPVAGTVPAPAPTPDQLITRIFKVAPDFLSRAQEKTSGGRKTAKESLEALGVPFPDGASATFVAATSQLVVRNVIGSIDLIEMLVADLNKPLPQVYITSRLVVLDGKPKQQGGTMKWKLAGTFTDPQYQVLSRYLQPKAVMPEGVKPLLPKELGGSVPQVLAVVQLPSVTPKLGTAARIELIREMVYPAEFDDKGKCTKSDMREIGFQLGVTALSIGAKKDGLEMTLEPHMESFVRWEEQPPKGGTKYSLPVFDSTDLQTATFQHDGETLMFSGDASVPGVVLDHAHGMRQGLEGFKGAVHPTLLFVTAKLILPDGNPVPPAIVPAGKDQQKVPVPEDKPVGQRVKISVVACEVSTAAFLRFDAAVKGEATRDGMGISGFEMGKRLLARLGFADVGESDIPCLPPPGQMAFSGVLSQAQAGIVMHCFDDKIKVKWHRGAAKTARDGEALKGFDLGSALQGDTFTVTPVLGPDGYTIDLAFTAPSLQPHPAAPPSTTSVTVWDKQAIVLGGVIPQDNDKADRQSPPNLERQGLLIFITPEIVP